MRSSCIEEDIADVNEALVVYCSYVAEYSDSVTV